MGLHLLLTCGSEALFRRSQRWRGGGGEQGETATLLVGVRAEAGQGKPCSQSLLGRARG